MSLLPDNQSESLDEYLLRQGVDDTEPTYTYRLNFESGRINGMIDERDALIQYIRKAIVTARSRYDIYTDDYGCELPDLIGQDVTRSYVDSEIPRMVREAIIYDDRITGVPRIDAEQRGDAVFIMADVESIYGDLKIEAVI